LQQNGCFRTLELIMFSFIKARLSAWRERERAFEELMSLDDRSLADIGIRRADIPFVLAGERTRDQDLFVQPVVGTPANANASVGTARKAA
jgi:uncharacterized protein YjiS (DUF1127 family)